VEARTRRQDNRKRGNGTIKHTTGIVSNNPKPPTQVDRERGMENPCTSIGETYWSAAVDYGNGMAPKSVVCPKGKYKDMHTPAAGPALHCRSGI